MKETKAILRLFSHKGESLLLAILKSVLIKTKSIYLQGNLDERVSDRVLYDVLIQAGRVVDLHIPRDKETNKPKGYAFAEYETEEIADYAVKLFSGLVTLYNRTLKFAISGQDKSSSNKAAPNLQYSSLPPNSVSSYPMQNGLDISHHSTRFSISSPFSSHRLNSEQGEPAPPGVGPESMEYRSHYDGNNSDFARRAFGTTMESSSRSRLSRHDF
ncbi:hypothetical protein V2J09_006324 [Rumex salicifolius]